MALFQRPNQMNALQAAQVNSYQRDLQKKDLLTLNKNLQYEESAFNKSLNNATTIAELPKGHLFASDEELINFKNNHDPSTVGFDSYLKFYGQEEAMARVLNGSNAASAILGYGKTIDLENTNWNADTKSFDVMVRTEDQEKGQARTNPMTAAGTTVQGLLAEGGRAAVEENTLPGVGIDEVNFFLEQIKSQGQNAAGGFSALENLGGMNKQAANIDFFQGDTREQLANLMVGGAPGAEAGAEAGTGTAPGTAPGTPPTNTLTMNESSNNANALWQNAETATFKGQPPVTEQTLAQILDFTKIDGDYANWSKEQLNPETGKKGDVHTPVGKYQFVGKTLKDIKDRKGFEELGFDDTTVFTEQNQDKLFEWYMNRTIKDAGSNATQQQIRDKIRGRWSGIETTDQMDDAELDGIISQVQAGTYASGGATAPATGNDSTSTAPAAAIGGPASPASDEIVNRNADPNQRSAFKNTQSTDYEANYFSKGLEAPFGRTREEFASDKYSDAERAMLIKNEKQLISRNVRNLYRDAITNGINKGKLEEGLRNFFGVPSNEKISVEDQNRLKEARQLYDKPGYGDAGSFLGGPLTPKKLEEIFNANPALVQQFQEDPIAFALAYKENPKDFEGEKVSTAVINDVVSDSPFKFKGDDAKSFLNSVQSGDVQTFANTLTTLAKKYVGDDEVPLEFQNKIVALLGSANNFLANSGQRRLDQHIMVGMWATLDDDQRKTYAPYMMRFAETGKFSFEGITAANQTAQVGINERSIKMQEKDNYVNLSPIGEKTQKIIDEISAPDYVYNSKDVGRIISNLSVAETQNDFIIHRNALGLSMKQWVADQGKGWFNSVANFFTGKGGTPDAAFQLQPDVVAYDRNNELVTRADQNVYRLVRVQPGNPNIQLSQKAISGGTVINQQGGPGMVYLKGLAIANAQLIKKGG